MDKSPEGVSREDMVRGQTYYTAADMATASAQGFRDGVAPLSAAEPAIPALQPVAWAIFAENGNIRLWSQKPLPHPSAQPLYTHPAPTLTQGAAIAAGAASGLDPEFGPMLEFANSGEIAFYDYAVLQHCAAVVEILDGKDAGAGECCEPWAAVRKRLLALVRASHGQATAQPVGAEDVRAVCDQVKSELAVLHDKFPETRTTPQAAQQAPSSYGSPELQAMIVARCIEKDRAQQAPAATTFCWATELAMTREPVTLTVKEAREVSGEMQRLHAEVEARRAGYRDEQWWLGWNAAMANQAAALAAGQAVAPAPTALTGENHAQLDMDSNASEPGQQRELVGALAVGQHVGDRAHEAAGNPCAERDVSLRNVAVRNLRSFLHGATFKSESDRQAALTCVDVLQEARPAPPAMDGEVVVTTDQQGRCVAVTRQDDEGRVLKIIWQAMDGGDAEDAKRYRWLRDDGVPNRSGERPWAVVRDGKGYAWCMGGALDERIDAARAAQKEEAAP